MFESMALGESELATVLIGSGSVKGAGRGSMVTCSRVERADRTVFGESLFRPSSADKRLTLCGSVQNYSMVIKWNILLGYSPVES